MNQANPEYALSSRLIQFGLIELQQMYALHRFSNWLVSVWYT